MAAALFVCFTESSHIDSHSVEAFQFLLKSPILHSVHQVIDNSKLFSVQWIWVWITLFVGQCFFSRVQQDELFETMVMVTLCPCIHVPRAHDPSDQQQGSRALAGPDFLSMRRVFVPYSQPIRFARFDRKSVNRGLPLLDQARALDPCCRSEGSWVLGMRMMSMPPSLQKNPTYTGLFCFLKISLFQVLSQWGWSKRGRMSGIWWKNRRGPSSIYSFSSSSHSCFFACPHWHPGTSYLKIYINLSPLQAKGNIKARVLKEVMYVFLCLKG